MNKNNTLNIKSLSICNSEVKEVLNIKNVYLSLFIWLSAVGLLILSSYVEDKSSAIYMGEVTVAIIFFIYGLFRLLFKRTHLIYHPTHSCIVNGSIYFDKAELVDLKEKLNANSVDLNKYTFSATGNARLDYYVSTDEKFVAVQLFEFVPYIYETASNIISYSEEEAKMMAQFLLQNYRKH